MRRTLAIGLLTAALLTGACSSASEPAGPVATPSATAELATVSPAASAVIDSAASPAASRPETSATPGPTPTEVTTVSPAPFILSSAAFADGAPIPRRFTCDGEDASPDLSWSGAPDGTRSLALLMTDPDARDFVHWIAYDMTGTPAGGLPTAVSSSPDAPPQGTNSFGKVGYGGPCPPSGTHHYVFVLSALDRPLELRGAPRMAEVRAAMSGHVLAETTLTGTYQR